MAKKSKSKSATKSTTKTNGTAPSGVSRRDFLKYGAMAGAAVGVAALHLSRASGTQTAEAAPARDGAAAPRAVARQKGDLNFAVDIEGLPETSANIDSINVEDLSLVRRTSNLAIFARCLKLRLLGLGLVLSLLATAFLSCGKSEDCIQLDESEWEGTITNLTHDIESDLQATITQKGCQLNGVLKIAPPLAGSGLLEGRLVQGSLVMTIDADTNDAGVDLRFVGKVEGNTLTGTYRVPDLSQEGEWKLFSSAEIARILEELYWISVETLARIPRSTSFEEANSRLLAVLANEFERVRDQYLLHGVDVQYDYPYCIPASLFMLNVLVARQTTAPTDAAGPVDRAIEALKMMREDLSIAEQAGRGSFSPIESENKCIELRNELGEFYGIE